MCACSHVVRDVLREDAVPPRRVHDDDVIEALTSDGPDHALHVGVLPRRSRSRAHRLNVHADQGGRDRCKDRIAIVQQLSGRFIVREGVATLLCRPRSRWMVGHRPVNDPSAIVREDDEYEEQPEGDRRHDDEVGCHDLCSVVREKGPPGL